MKLPDFVIIGMQRCGTSSLFVYLTAHPDMHGMVLGDKPRRATGGDEIHYFDYDENYAKGAGWYLNHIKHQCGIVGEKSPTYLHSSKAPRRLKKLMPDVRLIVLLRNPVDRAYSHYWKGRREKYETLPTFERALAAEPRRLDKCDSADFQNSARHLHSYVERGQYIDHLENWFTHFDRDQFTIIQSDVFFADPLFILSIIWEMFNLALPGDLQQQPDVRYQAGVYDPMNDRTRKRLEKHYAPYNRRLEAALDAEFTGWS